ncbi:MAG: YihY family inner membrane protein [Wenzhouxiangellaceae bacterium]
MSNKDTASGTGAAQRDSVLAQLFPEARWFQEFGRHLWAHFRHDRCFETAGALSYTSLLALVPLTAVVLGVVSAFPVFDHGIEQIQDFIFSNFVPAAGDVVRQYLDQFVERSAQLTGAGTLFLIVTALILMSTIEKALNRIWRVEKPRQPTSRLMMYWAVLTMGPLLLGASLGLTSYLAALPLMAPEFVRGPLNQALLLFTPGLVAMAAFTLIFLLVPNRTVRWRHALAGAAFSALAFELSKRGFVFYVTNFPTYERLYGALAAVPIFLVWIYVSWVVILLGASLAAALTTFSYQRTDTRWHPRHYLVLALRLIEHLWHAQCNKQGLSVQQLLEREPSATDHEIQSLLLMLERGGLVHQDSEGVWFLCVDLAEISLGELYRQLPLVLPLGELQALAAIENPDHPRFRTLQQLDEAAEPVMQCKLKSMLERDPDRCETG